MKSIQTYTKGLLPLGCALLLLAGGCGEDDPTANIPKEYADEYYAGGKAGTVFITSSFAYKQPMPCIDDDPTLYKQFMRGERLADKSFVADTTMAYSGLGPVYMRKSCIACHPSYGGHGQRVDKYDSNDSRNGYILLICERDNPTVLASQHFTEGAQTRAVPPFKAPVNENGITIEWLTYTLPEYGNAFPDGESYELIYPKVTVAQSAILFPDFDMSQHVASIESSIGIYGTGLIDAISDEDLRAEYATQQARGYAMGRIGADVDESSANDNPFTNPYYPEVRPGRFTYFTTNASIDNGGANSLWDVTNVTRPNRRFNYIAEEYAKLSSKDPDIQQALGKTEAEVYDYLMSKELKPEMTMEDYDAFMVWHRGLAVPAARNLDDPKVQRGKTLFTEAGCAACHRPSWTTRDSYKPLPALSSQKIYPYTDLLRHDLEMVEPGRVRVCRTTPLWGRGLMNIVSGHTDKLHDLRARNHTEAIMWHGGEAERSREKFYNMSKEDRDALIKFLDAI
jgi:CxxC motif-containing protein (DUF1111 family)